MTTTDTRARRMRFRRVLGIAAVAGSALALAPTSPAAAGGGAGMTQISGLARPGTIGVGPCDDPAHADADYALVMQGDLEGCWYGTITWAHGGASGTYQERADEVFVGTYLGRTGTFGAREVFSGKFDLDTGAELFGRCEHPIVTGTGTGALSGIRGFVRFTDDVETMTYPYTGHVTFR